MLPVVRRMRWGVCIVSLALLAGCQGDHSETPPARHTGTNATTAPATAAGATTAPALQRFQHAKIRMGVRVDLVAYAPDQDAADRAMIAAFNRITQLEHVMSDYEVKSELNQVVAKATANPGTPVPVSEDLFFILNKSVEMSRLSDGAFDITVGPYVALWRRARRTGEFPTPEELREASAKVGWQKIKLDPRNPRNPRNHTVALLVPGMKLDLGGIGKGFAGDCAIAVLREHGIRSAFYEAGGDIVVSDAPPTPGSTPGCKGWKIIVQHRGEDDSARRDLELANCAISSSGDTEQYVIHEGKVYSHIVDPKTGWGLTDRIAVTIIAPTGVQSEGLSKAGSILPPAKFQALIADMPGVSAYIRHVKGMPATRPEEGDRP